jgi:hypothetical protein
MGSVFVGDAGKWMGPRTKGFFEDLMHAPFSLTACMHFTRSHCSFKGTSFYASRELCSLTAFVLLLAGESMNLCEAFP